MSTRSQKRRNSLQKHTDNVSENLVSPVLVENEELIEQDVFTEGPSRAKSPQD